MELKKMCELSHKDYMRIRNRQKRGNMKVYYDDDGYILYDVEEDKNYKSKKSGRPPKN